MGGKNEIQVMGHKANSGILIVCAINVAYNKNITLQLETRKKLFLVAYKYNRLRNNGSVPNEYYFFTRRNYYQYQ